MDSIGKCYFIEPWNLDTLCVILNARIKSLGYDYGYINKYKNIFFYLKSIDVLSIHKTKK